MAYLITCAGSKREPINYNPSSLKKLSFNDELLKARKEIIRLTGIQLDWSKTLPAWELYSGTRSKIYPQIKIENWKKPCVEIKILSALFGWVDYTDLLPKYNLRMSDKIQTDKIQTVWRYWFNQNILDQIVNSNDDIDLLSGDYRKAIIGKSIPISKIPNIIFKGYGIEKGKWLNEELNKLICV